MTSGAKWERMLDAAQAAGALRPNTWTLLKYGCHFLGETGSGASEVHIEEYVAAVLAEIALGAVVQRPQCSAWRAMVDDVSAIEFCIERQGHAGSHRYHSDAAHSIADEDTDEGNLKPCGAE